MRGRLALPLPIPFAIRPVAVPVPTISGGPVAVVALIALVAPHDTTRAVDRLDVIVLVAAHDTVPAGTSPQAHLRIVDGSRTGVAIAVGRSGMRFRDSRSEQRTSCQTADDPCRDSAAAAGLSRG